MRDSILLHCRARRRGNGALIMLGLVFAVIAAAPLFIDLPSYMVAQQQLQNATDAAALAGAGKLPLGRTAAETAARNIALTNRVNGKVLQSNQLQFQSSNTRFAVTATAQVPTITTRILCSLRFTLPEDQAHPELSTTTQFTNNCNLMNIKATAIAEPAARDTMLVIDTSSSMGITTSGRTLLQHVQRAANTYVSTVAAQNSRSVDRIGLVNFDQGGAIRVRLTSTQQSPNYSSVTNSINGLRLFSGSGWNTNYQIGLDLALDELEANGRPLANKQIIFMTDGFANLPAPATYYNYNRNEPYRQCTDPVHNSTAVRNLCVRNSSNQLVCPALPSEQITDAMISSTAVTCGMNYTNHMVTVTNAETDRAVRAGVVITTIRIFNDSSFDSSVNVLRRLRKERTWDPGLLQYMATRTKGLQYSANFYDVTAINNIYATIAQRIRIKLSQ